MPRTSVLLRSFAGLCMSLIRASLAIQAARARAGSGKTSLLSAALGLLQQIDGPTVELRGKVCVQHLRCTALNLLCCFLQR